MCYQPDKVNNNVGSFVKVTQLSYIHIICILVKCVNSLNVYNACDYSVDLWLGSWLHSLHSFLLFVIELEEVSLYALTKVLVMLIWFDLQMELVKHKGGCHCGAVRFEVWSSPDLHVFHCKYVCMYVWQWLIGICHSTIADVCSSQS